MKNMTAPEKRMTEGQINKAVSDYRAMLEKYAMQFGCKPVQIVLGLPDFNKEMFEVFRRRVEMISSMIVRHVTDVDRKQNPHDVLKITGCNLHVSDDVVNAIPKGNGPEVDVVFFKLGHRVSDVDLGKEYERRGLVPVDPYSLAKVNENDPAFTDEYPNATHWKDADDKWCVAMFFRDGNRYVRIYHNDRVWGDSWWFAGLCK